MDTQIGLLRAENEELKRQLGLYRSSHEILGCLELEKIGTLIVSSFISEVGVARGLGIFLDEEGLFSLKGMQDMEEASARSLAELILAAFERRQQRDESILVLTDFIPADPAHAFASRADLREAVVVGIGSANSLNGIVAIFNDPGKSLPEFAHDSLRFLADNSLRGLENATRFTSARNMINIDELTGLFNYRYLESALDREIKRAERYRSALSVVFLDLDQFKEVNDTHGHLVGSKVLREIGHLLKGLVREVDTVIRYGGDEYTIILVESTIIGASRVAERIRAAVEAHTFLASEGMNIRLTASLGYACYPDDSQSYVELLQMADQAMYRGKFSGKNVVFHISQTKEGEQT